MTKNSNRASALSDRSTRFRRRARRRTQARHAPAGFDVCDYTLLAVLCCLGLVWTRLVFVMAVIPSPCIEAVITYDQIASGPWAGRSVWDMFWMASGLAAVYALVLLATRLRTARKTVSLFRLLALIGLVTLAQTLRAVSAPDTPVPDGKVLVAPHNPPNDPFEYLSFIRPACVFLDRNQLVFAQARPEYGSADLYDLYRPDWILGGPGTLLDRYARVQVYHEMSPEQREAVIVHMDPVAAEGRDIRDTDRIVRLDMAE